MLSTSNGFRQYVGVVAFSIRKVMFHVKQLSRLQYRWLIDRFCLKKSGLVGNVRISHSALSSTNSAPRVESPIETSSAVPVDDQRNNGYSFEELLQNIREKSSERRRKVHARAKRDVLSLMTINELTEFLKTENAIDVSVIGVSPEKCYVDYMVICSGSSTRHIRRMAGALASKMKHVRVTGDHALKTDHRRVIVEGEESDEWMAVDIGNIVVHFMLNETREFYQIEKLWTLEGYDDMTKEMTMHNYESLLM